MKTVAWTAGHVDLIDQTRLPQELVVDHYTDYRQLAEAIRSLKVRGAPAIGVTAAMALALAAKQSQASDTPALLRDLRQAAAELEATRPTAVNLGWGLRRMLAVADSLSAEAPAVLIAALEAEARHMAQEDEDRCRAMGAFGQALIPAGANVLTHCNAGALACVDYGTALGVIRAAHERGDGVHVWVDETRPILQGARLTAWELAQEHIPHTLITDNMAGSLMRHGRVTCAVVGADRIAANGDVANKIGTYSVAILAHAHRIPFYVAAPTSTVDLNTASGDDIIIEQRDPEEVRSFRSERSAPAESAVYNPAFDVTPAAYITAIITENGVARPPYTDSLAALARAGQPVGRFTR